MQKRLVDLWKKRSERDPAEVVKSFHASAPSRMLAKKPLTQAEKKLWRRLRDRDRMGVDVFSRVPVFLPHEGLERMMTFFIPRLAVCIEVSRVDFAHGTESQVVDQMMEDAFEDELLREVAEVVTMRCPENRVRKSTDAVVETIRWDLGLADELPRGMRSTSVPRRGEGGT